MTNLKDYSIVFVEDDIYVTKSFSRILDVTFKNVYYTKNGFEALEILETQKIDLVVTDLKMPIMDGFTLIEQVKKSYEKLPIVVVTALRCNEDEIKKLDVDGFILKPLDVVEFINTSKKIFNLD